MVSHLAGANIATMSDAEFQAFKAGKQANVDAARDQIIANLHRPRGFESARRFERIAMAMVQHGESASAVKASTDGDESKAQWIPKSQMKITRETEEFFLAIMPGWLVIDRKLMQARTPQLTTAREWTAEQQTAWKELRKSLDRVRGDQKHDAMSRKYRRRTKIYRERLPQAAYGE